MYESPPTNCPKCNVSIKENVELCPKCGAEMDLTRGSSVESTQQHQGSNEAQTSGSSKAVQNEQADPEGGTSDGGTADDDRHRTASRSGFTLVFGVTGVVFLLAPAFLIDLEVLMTPLFLFSGKTGPNMMLPSYGFGPFIATALTMVSGVLCLFAATLQISGISHSTSKTAGTLGILMGWIGIIMIFVI